MQDIETAVPPIPLIPSNREAKDLRNDDQSSREDVYFIAKYLAQNSSKAAAVFRRYDKLAIYRLIQLSKELESLENRQGDVVRGTYPAGDTGDDARISKCLTEYYGLMCAYGQVLHFEPPAERTVEALDRFIRKRKLHPYNLEWRAHRLKYSVERDGPLYTFPDLVSLFTPAENDYLSRFVDKYLYFLFKTPESDKETMYVNEQKLQRFVTFTGTVFAIGFLISAMWVLWRLKDNMIAKLATVTGFVVAFAAWSGFLTTMQRKDVIAATAAYAAVLVVFVSQPT